MTTQPVYNIVRTIEGCLIPSRVLWIEEWCAINGFEITGQSDNPRLRPELQGHPIIAGLLGPMWDGGMIRYEDHKTYNQLSQ